MKKTKASRKYVGLEKISGGIGIVRHKRSLKKHNLTYLCTLENYIVKSKSPEYDKLHYITKLYIQGQNTTIREIHSISFYSIIIE